MSRLKEISKDVRNLIIETAYNSKGAHVGSSLSCVDLLVSLYFNKLKIDENNWDNRDIFVLSKAHAAVALYSTLTVKGFMDKTVFDSFMQNGGKLPAHLDRFTSKGIEVSAGSLGHGFNIALGMAYGYKLKNDNREVFTLIGDGESQEGSIWEGALFAPHLHLDNFTAILDYNNLQGYGKPTEICNYKPVADKWKAFGWEVYEIDGHNFNQIANALDSPHHNKPKMIIAYTTKGKGVSFMENQMKWHYYIVTEEIMKQAKIELGR